MDTINLNMPPEWNPALPPPEFEQFKQAVVEWFNYPPTFSHDDIAPVTRLHDLLAREAWRLYQRLTTAGHTHLMRQLEDRCSDLLGAIQSSRTPPGEVGDEE